MVDRNERHQDKMRQRKQEMAEIAVRKHKLDMAKCIKIRKDFPDIMKIPVSSTQLPNVIKGYGNFYANKLNMKKEKPEPYVKKVALHRAL